MAQFPTPHTARIRELVEDTAGGWIEGEPTKGPVATDVGTVPCYLFLPLGTEDDAQPRRRKLSRPTVMWDPAEVVGDRPTADHELWITAPELVSATGAIEVRWQIEGDPQPFGAPGETVIGAQATLKRLG